MNDLKKILVFIFNNLAKNIQTLPDEDIKDILSGNAKMGIVIYKNKSELFARKTELHDMEIDEIVKRLRNMTTREEGLDFLKESCHSKPCLILVARSLDLPVQQKDSIARISDKIIEATIGFRLTSKAIRDYYKK
jgi:hypothetical protein